ncbi:hypothetical protein LCGC14_2741390, partial [marine sediment metagenome]
NCQHCDQQFFDITSYNKHLNSYDHSLNEINSQIKNLKVFTQKTITNW